MTVDDGGESNSEVGEDTGVVSGPDAGVDSPVDAPVADALAVEAGDALALLDGVSGNCYQQIKDNGYAAGTATPCASCKDNNSFSKENDCKAALDCLAAAGMSCTGNCFDICLDQGGGAGGPGGVCVTNLITAAGCQ